MHLIQQQQPPLAAGYIIHDLQHHCRVQSTSSTRPTLLQALVLPTGTCNLLIEPMLPMQIQPGRTGQLCVGPVCASGEAHPLPALMMPDTVQKCMALTFWLSSLLRPLKDTMV